MVTQCRHIRTSGTQCGMIAMRGQNFCYYHQNSQPRPVRSTIRTRPHTQTQTYDYGAIPVADRPTPEIQPPVQLLFPEDRASIQINLYRISVAQAENRIDTRTANSMTWNQQVCMANLGRQPLIEAAPSQLRSQSRSRSQDSDHDSDSTYSDPGSNPPSPVSRLVSRVILTPDGDEIAPPAEILEDDEAEPIHHRLCPCLLCAEKHRNWPGEEHHPQCQCGLCEEPEPETATDSGAPSLAQPKVGDQLDTGTNPSAETARDSGAPRPDSRTWVETETANPCRPRIARASALLSGSTNRDPLNRPWSVAEYTFGDAIRRHEAQYAARAAAALAVGIEPPPYQPYRTGLIRPGTPEHAEDRQMQQFSDEYWSAHFRAQIAERPDIQQYLSEEEASNANG